MILNSYLIPYTKINSKRIKDLNMRLETIKLLEENIKENLCNTGFGNNFLYKTKSAGNKRKIGKWNYIKLKNCTQQRKQQSKKSNLWNGRKYLQTTYLIRGFISRVYKELL